MYVFIIHFDKVDTFQYLFLGFVYRSQGRNTEAIEEYKQAIRIDPDYADAYLALGFAYLFTGNRGAALEEYKILKGLNREYADELFNSIYE